MLLRVLGLAPGVCLVLGPDFQGSQLNLSGGHIPLGSSLRSFVCAHALLTGISWDKVERVNVREVISAVYIDTLQQSHNHP